MTQQKREISCYEEHLLTCANFPPAVHIFITKILQKDSMPLEDNHKILVAHTTILCVTTVLLSLAHFAMNTSIVMLGLSILIFCVIIFFFKMCGYIYILYKKNDLNTLLGPMTLRIWIQPYRHITLIQRSLYGVLIIFLFLTSHVLIGSLLFCAVLGDAALSAYIRVNMCRAIEHIK